MSQVNRGNNLIKNLEYTTVTQGATTYGGRASNIVGGTTTYTTSNLVGGTTYGAPTTAYNGDYKLVNQSYQTATGYSAIGANLTQRVVAE
jgi:hypothetical protein